MDLSEIVGKCPNAELKNLKKIGDVILCRKKGYGYSPSYKIREIENRNVCVVMSFYKPDELHVEILDINKDRMYNSCSYPNKK